MKPIYAELCMIAEPILKHYVEDLEIHDKKALYSVVKSGETWAWQVRPSGTWLVRWDKDPEAGSKNSLLEILIRQTMQGNWADSQWHIIHCHEFRNGQPYGTVSQPIPTAKLAAALPRLKLKATTV
jgi:hypothetical protein